jgi:hypothetical protein
LQQQHFRTGGLAIALHSFGAGAVLLEGQAKIIATRGGHARGGRANAATGASDDHEFS